MEILGRPQISTMEDLLFEVALLQWTEVHGTAGFPLKRFQALEDECYFRHLAELPNHSWILWGRLTPWTSRWSQHLQQSQVRADWNLKLVGKGYWPWLDCWPGAPSRVAVWVLISWSKYVRLSNILSTALGASTHVLTPLGSQNVYASTRAGKLRFVTGFSSDREPVMFANFGAENVSMVAPFAYSKPPTFSRSGIKISIIAVVRMETRLIAFKPVKSSFVPEKLARMAMSFTSVVQPSSFVLISSSFWKTRFPTLSLLWVVDVSGRVLKSHGIAIVTVLC